MRVLEGIFTRLFLASLMFCVSAALAAESPFVRGWTAYSDGDYQTAYQLWQPLAQQGDVQAQVNLGLLFDYGRGVDADPSRAAHWYEKAARQGNASAQFNLALLYQLGRGVDLDQAQAVTWLRMAAQQDLVFAQEYLAQAYEQGHGIKQNAQLAGYWYDRAARRFLDQNDTLRASDMLKALRRLDAQHPRVAYLQAQLDRSSTSKVRKASMGKRNSFSAGTAWPVASGYAVTNHHVVGDANRVTLVLRDGREVRARVVDRDERHDIALLAVTDQDTLPPALPLARHTARLGTSVFTIGYPRIDIMGRTPKLSDGIISSVQGMYGDPDSYQISVPVQPGNSGGPLLNMKGEVVGLITAMLGTVHPESGQTTVIPNVSYALKVDILKAMLSRQTHQDHMYELPANGGDLEALADRIQNSVMIVMANED